MIIFDSPNARTKIAEATGTIVIPGVHRCISRHDKAGNVLGGAIFTDYTGSSVQMHTACFAKNWLNRFLLYCVFDFAFNILRVKKVITIIEVSNQKAVSFNLHLGFTKKVVIDDWFLSGAAVITEMRKEDCKYLGYLKGS